jgi:uncharacterized protein YbbC (DUF1343 family)
MFDPTRLHRKLVFGTSLSLLFVLLACSTPKSTVVTPIPELPKPAHATDAVVRSGLEVFLDRDFSADTLTYALLANQTAVDRNLVHAVDLLTNKIDLQLLLSPEHGLFGAENAGDAIGDERDASTGIRSVTTYRKKPAEIAELIRDIDVVLFDIQDIGVRSYTYVYSMAYLMEAAGIAGKKIIVLDRPNPVNGIQVEGNILDPQVSSFVGMFPIPYRHGMTTGELALLFQSEFSIECDLEVVPLEGWKRSMWFDETGLTWVPTSPHVPDAETILPMIATGTYGELGKLSEGVGITTPFEVAGGPWIKNPHLFAKALGEQNIAGIIFRPTFFKPYYGRHKGEVCGGVQLHVVDRDVYKPYLCGLQIMYVHQQLYPDVDLFENENRWSMFAKVMGTEQFRLDIQAGKTPETMESEWRPGLDKFLELRQPYLLYD